MPESASHSIQALYRTINRPSIRAGRGAVSDGDVLEQAQALQASSRMTRVVEFGGS